MSALAGLGLHDKYVQIFGHIMQSDRDIHSRCRECFPGDGLVQVIEPVTAEESFSTSSPSSGGPRLPARKKVRGGKAPAEGTRSTS